MFKVIIYQRTNLQSGAIANLDVVKASISEDLSQKASSTITCASIPTNVQIYDLLRLYDTKGRFIYWGIINAITDNVIKCSQFQSLYNDNIHEDLLVPEVFANLKVSGIVDWYLRVKEGGYFYTYTENGTTFVGTLDRNVKNYYKGITHTVSDSSNRHMPVPEDYQMINLESWLYDIFNSYSILLKPIWVSGNIPHINIAILYPNGKITTSGETFDFSQTKLFDTYENISNLSITKEDEDVNTVHIWYGGQDGEQIYTILNDGRIVEVRNNVEVANRVGCNKTTFIEYDGQSDPMDMIYKALPNLQYNHKITFDILFTDNNKYEDYILGKKIQFYENAHNRLFDTMLTAWKYEIEENSDVIKKATFTLGKVRNSLTDKLMKKRHWWWYR